MTLFMLRTAPVHNGLLLFTTKLMDRILTMLIPILAADKSDHTPVQSNNSPTVNYEVLKALDVCVKV